MIELSDTSGSSKVTSAETVIQDYGLVYPDCGESDTALTFTCLPNRIWHVHSKILGKAPDLDTESLVKRISQLQVQRKSEKVEYNHVLVNAGREDLPRSFHGVSITAQVTRVESALDMLYFGAKECNDLRKLVNVLQVLQTWGLDDENPRVNAIVLQAQQVMDNYELKSSKKRTKSGRSFEAKSNSSFFSDRDESHVRFESNIPSAKGEAGWEDESSKGSLQEESPRPNGKQVGSTQLVLHNHDVAISKCEDKVSKLWRDRSQYLSLLARVRTFLQHLEENRQEDEAKRLQLERKNSRLRKLLQLKVLEANALSEKVHDLEVAATKQGKGSGLSRSGELLKLKLRKPKEKHKSSPVRKKAPTKGAACECQSSVIGQLQQENKRLGRKIARFKAGCNRFLQTTDKST